MRYRRNCPNSCNSPNDDCPEYTPDFIRLAESYGARGIRVTSEKEIAAALKMARDTSKVPTVIEFIIDRSIYFIACGRQVIAKGIIQKAVILNH